MLGISMLLSALWLSTNGTGLFLECPRMGRGVRCKLKLQRMKCHGLFLGADDEDCYSLAAFVLS